MKNFFRLLSPKRAAQDFAGQWHQPTPHRWPILGVALALTFAIFMAFVPKSERIAPKPPKVIYISTFAPDRSEAEIIASNCENQILRDHIEALLEERAEARKEIYRTLGRATFVDVDEIDAEIEAEHLAEEAQAEKDAEELAGKEAEEASAQLSFEEYCARAAQG